ncbi:MAG: hypothetical protein NTY98_26450 [Verrucomicrobia bacterium]|nr:hypothetical protein [Verrucomicrobiota bacterium]
MNPQIGYISNGRLYLKPPGGREEEIVSEFSNNLKKRLQSVQDRQGFRGGGSGAGFMRGGLPTAEPASVEDTFRSEFSCAGSQDGNVCYAIDANEVRALFEYNPGEKYERRLLHGPKHRFSSISTRRNEESPEWLLTAAQDHGVSRICLFKPEAGGGGLMELTEGDSLDTFPVWEPGNARSLVYQTCGIARHAQTHEWAGLGPATLHRLNLDSGDMETVAEDVRYDFLCPSFSPEGTLYYLRRPYEPFHTPSFWNILKDIVLFPFRLVRAIFGFLNVFSMLFSGKPLQTAGRPPQPQAADPKAVFLHGRWVNMEKAMKNAAQNELSHFVPRNWQLMRHVPDGEAQVVCEGVMAYAVGANETVYFSNGAGVFVQKDGSSKPEKVSDRKLVTSIFVL